MAPMMTSNQATLTGRMQQPLTTAGAMRSAVRARGQRVQLHRASPILRATGSYNQENAAEQQELARIQAENAKLKEILRAHLAKLDESKVAQLRDSYSQLSAQASKAGVTIQPPLDTVTPTPHTVTLPSDDTIALEAAAVAVVAGGPDPGSETAASEPAAAPAAGGGAPGHAFVFQQGDSEEASAAAAAAAAAEAAHEAAVAAEAAKRELRAGGRSGGGGRGKWRKMMEAEEAPEPAAARPVATATIAKPKPAAAPAPAAAAAAPPPAPTRAAAAAAAAAPAAPQHAAKPAANSVAAAAPAAAPPKPDPAVAAAAAAKQKEEQARQQQQQQQAAEQARLEAEAKAKLLEREKRDNAALKLRAAAREEVQGHNPQVVAKDRHHWLVFTVPEVPVAGEDCVIYFNKNQSEALRSRNRVQCQYAFNSWELQAEGGGSVWCTTTTIARDQGADYYSCRVAVPKDSYEMNFIFTDAEGLWENNAGKDFVFQVAGGSTWDEWVDSAAERAATAEAKRLAAEAAAAAAEAERQRQAKLEADERAADQMVADLRNSLGWMQDGAKASFSIGEGADAKLLWVINPLPVRAGGTATLLYNRAAGCLAWLQIPDDKALTLKYGFNQWKKPGSLVLERSSFKGQPGEEWWEGSLEVPMDAAVLNFCVNYFEHWDSNGGKDYKGKLELPEQYGDSEAWLAALRPACLAAIKAERLAKEEAERLKQQQRESKRREAQAIVRSVQRRQIRHVLFTDPEVVEAGDEVTLYYSPQDTCLNGRQKIYVTGGFNRWSHPRKFGPIEMTPPEDGTHFRATIKVPKDAFKMDFVFSDVESGEGTYDNRGGLDYSLPVEGSPVHEKPLYVAHISVEMAPIAKVGGLGDVVTALGRAVKDEGHQVEVILPKYDFFNHSPLLQGNLQYETEFDWGGTRIFVTTAVVEGLRCYFIEPKNGFFQTQSVYGRYDDEVRFDFFCKAALEFLLKTSRQPDILHCHDWSTAHVAKSYWEDYHNYGLWKPKVVFTIHNLNYGQKKLAEAAYYSQKFTTVSPTYAFEVGGSPILASHGHKFMGIRNGIDMELWDPENNAWLPVPFNADNVVEGKAAAKAELRKRLNLTTWNDKLLVGVVSRLTKQKGVHLIKHTAWRAVDRGGQFVLLGSAPDPKVQGEFNDLANTMQGQDAAFCFKYDEPLSHLIYAACDIIVVPSMFEPCGLTQMIAMRYGAVPVVRHTGGLRDTVFDVDFDKARAAWEMMGSSDWQRDKIDETNGFAFEGTDNDALDYALNRAIDAWYNDRQWFHSLQGRVMRQDWSWNRPAIDYIELYYSATRG